MLIRGRDSYNGKGGDPIEKTGMRRNEIKKICPRTAIRGRASKDIHVLRKAETRRGTQGTT